MFVEECVQEAGMDVISDVECGKVCAYNDVNLGGGKDWRFVIEWCDTNVHTESL
jgi:hypothetical protein